MPKTPVQYIFECTLQTGTLESAARIIQPLISAKLYKDLCSPQSKAYSKFSGFLKQSNCLELNLFLRMILILHLYMQTSSTTNSSVFKI